MGILDKARNSLVEPSSGEIYAEDLIPMEVSSLDKNGTAPETGSSPDDSKYGVDGVYKGDKSPQDEQVRVYVTPIGDVHNAAEKQAVTGDVEEVVVKNNEDIAEFVVSSEDDPDLPVMTFRFYFLGIGLAAFGSVLAEIYYWKPQGATVSVLFQLIISYVLGNAMARFIPSRGLFRYLNPGPFNIKEHACITICASTASGTATAISVIAVLDLFYNVTMNPGVAILQTWASQVIGYGFCGVLQSTLVFPSYCLWPANIPIISLLQSMHFGGLLNKKRMRYFWMVFGAIFLWEIIPTWMFPLLTAFSIVCIADNGRHEFVRNLFGGGSSNEGLGLFSFGFDWILITQAFPLYWPLQTQVNSWIGMALCYFLMIGSYYGDVGQGRSNGLPFMSTDIFTNNGSAYDQTQIINVDGSLNVTSYEAYGRPYFTTSYAMSLAISNLSTGAAVTHVLLFHWRDIVRGVKSLRFSASLDDIEDPHYQKMRVYKKVPQWWFAIVLVVSLAVAIGTAYYNKQFSIPWWSIIVFTIIAFFFSIFVGFLNAVTGYQPNTNAVIQLLAALVHPGKPIANLYASLYGYSTSYQTILLLSDQKLGQYAKVPPRCTFAAQLIGTIVGASLNYVLYKSIVSANREILLDPLGSRIWAGWNAQETNSGALTWGALAKELYYSGKPYWYIPACLGFGLLVPIPLWLMSKKFPKQWIWSYLNIPIIATYMGWLPYSVNGMWWPGFLIGLASQWWARTRRPKWFISKNYLTSAALDGGTQVIYFILNFAVFGASGNAVQFPYWWGNADPDVLSVDRCMVPG